MVREIVKDAEILTQKSEKFVIGQDEHLIKDMLDTANEHKERCIGLACIQIGVPKRVILVRQGDKFVPYINPIIVSKSTKTYIAKEGCLSVEGVRSVKRHYSIKLLYTDRKGKTRSGNFNGLPAQIIQHECDHLNGILI
jgi:peptide deformylase